MVIFTNRAEYVLLFVKYFTNFCPGANPATCTNFPLKNSESLCILTIDFCIKVWYNIYVRKRGQGNDKT